jgi:hypothetical protein
VAQWNKLFYCYSEDDGHMARSHIAEQEKSYSAGPHQTRGELSFAVSLWIFISVFLSLCVLSLQY